ncbi:MAG: RNA polymerase sigma factor [Acidobacteria bacterium]|nr:RNA polymerase sigma factor [Acidobacteriota bacterium]MCA1611769.1 RNA polymerase sigma factor [Acidobacteriota bacterium]
MELVYSEVRRRQETAEQSDRELALSARSGDMLSFEALVVRKTPAVVSVARRIVADPEDARDVAQMVFLRVWEQLDRYDATYSFNTWLYRIATNLSIDFLRSSRSRERAHGATLYLVRQREEATGGETSRAAEDGDMARVFREASERLTGKQKAAFVLREMEDKDTDEIAKILGCGESTVRNHLFNARRILRKEIEKICPGFLRARRGATEKA